MLVEYASIETPQCLADIHTYGDCVSWLANCHGRTVSERETVELWLRDLTTAREEVHPPPASDTVAYSRLRVALRENVDAALVNKHQWPWPYCLWQEHKSLHLASLQAGITNLGALKICYVTHTEEIDKVDQKIMGLDGQITWQKNMLLTCVAGQEAAKYRALADKYDNLYRQQAIHKHLTRDKNSIIAERQDIWKEVVLPRKDLVPVLNIEFITEEEKQYCLPRMQSLYNQETQTAMEQDTQKLCFWSSINMKDSPIRAAKAQKTRHPTTLLQDVHGLSVDAATNIIASTMSAGIPRINTGFNQTSTGFVQSDPMDAVRAHDGPPVVSAQTPIFAQLVHESPEVNAVLQRLTQQQMCQAHQVQNCQQCQQQAHDQSAANRRAWYHAARAAMAASDTPSTEQPGSEPPTSE